MIRITSGVAKNKSLALPRTCKQTAVKEVVKLAIFSILNKKTENGVFLDLFAGSGNLGIEALSRGALHCDFVDIDEKAIKTINENLKLCNLYDKANVIQEDAKNFLLKVPTLYDVIFADPYYNFENYVSLVSLGTQKLKEKGLLFLLTQSKIKFNQNLQDLERWLMQNQVKFDKKRYGKSSLYLLTKE